MKNKLGLYIHLPFCVRKCLYCDFCSVGGASEEYMHRYTDALVAEMAHYAPSASAFGIDTVFFGGGTPTLLPLSDWERIWRHMHDLFYIDSGAEVTVEANPATAGREKLSFLRTLGVNRLSIGVQSLNDNELCALGRVHNAEDAYRFFEDARASGFHNINVDLMYGIPLQTEQSFSKTLDGVLTLVPEHISAYSLIVEEGTPFFEKKEKLPLPSEDVEDALHTLLLSRLEMAGYTHYEISNFAKSGFSCRHNLHYWRSEPYLGFGAAAYSYFNGARYGNTRNIAAYMKDSHDAVTECETPNAKELAYEYIMLAFRLREGVDTDVYKKRFGVTIEEKYASLIRRFTEEGLMQKSGNRLFLTERGMRLSNTVLVAFMQEDF